MDKLVEKVDKLVIKKVDKEVKTQKVVPKKVDIGQSGKKGGQSGQKSKLKKVDNWSKWSKRWTNWSQKRWTKSPKKVDT